MDADYRVRVFAKFLSASWEAAQALARATPDDEDFIASWQQGNWEMLVEAGLPWAAELYLSIYDGGADVYGDSSRIYQPRALPTHIVVCKPMRADRVALDLLHDEPITFPEEGIPIGALVSFDGTWYHRAPPFDHVLVGDHTHQQVFSLDSIRFTVRPVRPDEI